MPDDLETRLKKYRGQVEKRNRIEAVKQSHEVTRASLVGPLFVALGWDLTDPTQCISEDRPPIAHRRSLRSVDWTFFHKEKRIFIVEIKRCSDSLRGHSEQLGDYFCKTKVKLGILTNGVEWQFFTDLDCSNLMDQKPFLRWNVVSDEKPPLELLTLLLGVRYDPDAVRMFARRIMKLEQPVLKSRTERSTVDLPQWFAALSIAERCDQIPKLIQKYGSARAAARELEVDDKTVLNWSRVSQLLPEIRDALLEGENTGLSLRNLRQFFNRTAHNNGHNLEAKPPHEQLRILDEERAKGRGGAKRKRQPPAARLSHASQRFPTLVRIIQQRSLVRSLVAAKLAPNGMTVTRWGRGQQQATEVQIKEIVEWAASPERFGSAVRSIYSDGESHWERFRQEIITGPESTLAALRKSLHLSQLQVAEALGVSRYTYLLCERGEGSADLAARARSYLKGLSSQ